MLFYIINMDKEKKKEKDVSEFIMLTNFYIKLIFKTEYRFCKLILFFLWIIHCQHCFNLNGIIIIML